ncbi:MAG: deoxyribose-phosphate aldolase [Candidatus Marinimicrobia bacterium]|nr:deoxyribose-phosphate aldolase [Candidatus Neomarinimicrobiota bacterium]
MELFTLKPEEAKKNIVAIIDHTILKPETTEQEVVRVCREAMELKTASVCVNPCFVKFAVAQLAGSGIPVTSVIGFPLGANATEIKGFETELALKDGAQEFDMVINIGALKSGNFDFVKKDIQAVVKAASGKIVKVILETVLLTEKEKIKACELAVQAGARFVKTSTGFSKGGATVEDIALMRKTVGNQIGVKASGGIRTFTDAMEMVRAGANRIGASSAKQIAAGIVDFNSDGY